MRPGEQFPQFVIEINLDQVAVVVAESCLYQIEVAEAVHLNMGNGWRCLGELDEECPQKAELEGSRAAVDCRRPARPLSTSSVPEDDAADLAARAATGRVTLVLDTRER